MPVDCLQRPNLEFWASNTFSSSQMDSSFCFGTRLTPTHSWFLKAAGYAKCRQWLSLTGLHERDPAAEMKELWATSLVWKAASTSASPSAIWRCEGAGEQEAARWDLCVMESSQVSLSALVIVNTQINIVFLRGHESRLSWWTETVRPAEQTAEDAKLSKTRTETGGDASGNMQAWILVTAATKQQIFSLAGQGHRFRTHLIKNIKYNNISSEEIIKLMRRKLCSDKGSICTHLAFW